jgi:hypothetical protein
MKQLGMIQRKFQAGFKLTSVRKISYMQVYSFTQEL